MKTKVFWNNPSPPIDLSEELNDDNLFANVIRQKHNANDATNLTIIIESDDRTSKSVEANDMDDGVAKTLLVSSKSKNGRKNG